MNVAILKLLDEAIAIRVGDNRGCADGEAERAVDASQALEQSVDLLVRNGDVTESRPALDYGDRSPSELLSTRIAHTLTRRPTQPTANPTLTTELSHHHIRRTKRPRSTRMNKAMLKLLRKTIPVGIRNRGRCANGKP